LLQAKVAFSLVVPAAKRLIGIIIWILGWLSKPMPN
jgi:hypothetical protein